MNSNMHSNLLCRAKPGKRSRERGQALVEFVLVFAFFLMFILVIFDLARATYYYSAINNAVREGARYGSVDPNAGRIAAETKRLAVGLNLSPVVTITTSQVQVAVQYNFSTATPILSLLTGSNTITLHSRATMNLEQ